MDGNPFEPAQPVYPPDEAERLEATKRRIQQLRTRKATLGGAVTVALVGIVAGLALTSAGKGGHPVEVAGQGTDTSSTTTPVATSTTPTTMLPPATSTTTTTFLPPATITTIAETTTTNVIPHGVNGVVTDASGHPVAGAIVQSQGGQKAVTDSQGRYSIQCGGALLASTWSVPFFSFGDSIVDATTPGPGYIFSGGATDVSHATTPSCGSVENFHLPPGAGVSIHFTNPMPSGPGPADNLYLPGLIDNGYFIDPPLDSNNDQVVDQLGSGTLRIDGVMTDFDCSGPGVTGSGAIWYVPVKSGQSTTVNCAFVSTTPSS